MIEDSTNDISSELISKDIIAKVSSGVELSNKQLKQLRETIESTLSNYNIGHDEEKEQLIDLQQENAQILRNFINAKRIEGLSNTTLYNYAKEVTKLFLTLNKSYRNINSQDIRDYLAWRKRIGNLESVTIQNMRMYLKSFFKWCYIEELIPKNPMDKIGVIKVEQHVVQVLSDEEQEIIRCACTNERDRAIIDILSGSGIRVSELCGLNKEDIDFDHGEFKVLGKGNKERICFLTGKAKVHLKWYLDSRTDDNEAAFVNEREPHGRMSKSGVEFMLKSLAKRSKIPKCRLYPHKYRSTLATNMINRGAPAEQVQGILGHSSVDTTLKCYCKIDTETYKQTHHKYVD